ncbi:MAG: polysaccharide deacetylase [Pleurocapsa sp.]
MTTNITIDGNLSDWTTNERLDFLPGTGQVDYEVYGKLQGDSYIFAIQSDGTAIGAGTTVWLNTDRDSNTGHQVFGSTVGAEYNVNFYTYNTTYLYTGAAGENFVNGGLNYSYSNNNQTIEFAVPVALLGSNPQSVDVVIDVNDQVFLPGNFGAQNYTIFADKNLPERTDDSKKVGIVFSQTTADQFFGLSDVAANQTAYAQLFMSVQEEVMMSGVPFDLLTEDDLKDINNLVNYDTLVFPSIRNVQQSDVQQIQDTLTDAVYQYNIGIVAAGDFMTNSETGGLLEGDPYSRMKSLLGLQPEAFGTGNVSLTAENTTNEVLQEYDAGEVIREYQNPIGYAAYSSYANETADVLVNQTVNEETYNAVVATETGGRNVHFATTGYLGDNNLAWEAVRWSTFENQPTVTLAMTRNESLFLSRNDMDVSQFYFSVNPDDGSAGIYDIMLPIVEQWKTDFNFVGSYYINIGDSVEEGIYTDWELSRLYYDKLLAAGNEIGTHSYTHLQEYAGYNPTNNTNLITPAQIEFEFNQSKQVIEQQLGINVTGTAVPGAPEQLPTSEEIIQYFDYMTGGASIVGAGYPGALGFLSPDQESVYFAPNLWFDFTLIGFGIPVADGNGGFVPQPLTAAEAEVEWIRQYNEVTSHSNKPIFLMPWHDYGPTNFENNGYNESMFTSLIREAYENGAEFVTLDDASQRIKAFEQSQLFIETSGNTITAEVVGTNVGDFALDVSDNQTIQSVDNWYAYDNNSVFIPRNGGQFTINLGTTQDNVTRITELPMRAELDSLTGDGTNLDYTFTGEGKVVVELANPNTVSIIGADSMNLNGSTVEMTFDRINQHNAQVIAATAGDDTLEGSTGQDILVGGAGNDTIYGDLQTGSDNLIVNGGFETNTNANGAWKSYDQIEGWQRTGNDIEIHKLYRGYTPTEGSSWVELDAGGIVQSINTTSGSTYQVSFEYSPRPFYNASDSILEVYWNGTLIDTLAQNGETNTNWNTYTYELSTDQNYLTNLEFRAGGVQNSKGAFLDNVQVRELSVSYSHDILNGGAGNDILNGGAGNDVLSGVDSASSTPGVGEVDILNGGAGKDTFVLGNADAIYYGYGVATGLLDVAVIEDFNRHEDTIQLKGSASDYSLRVFGSNTVLGSNTQVGSGVGILSSSREIVGFVQDVNLLELNLNSTSFEYV